MSTTLSQDIALTEIIDEIYSGEYQLPEFQRDYVWKASDVKSLFESVLLGHPIGSLLILKMNQDTPMFAWTNFDNIYPDPNRTLNYAVNDRIPPKFLVLDGQQRLTSLSKLSDTNDRKLWFLDLKKIKESWVEGGMPIIKLEINKWIETNLDIASALCQEKNNISDPLDRLRSQDKLMPLSIIKDTSIFSNEIISIRDTISSQNFRIEDKISNIENSGVTNSSELSILKEDYKENLEWIKFLGTPISQLFDNYYNYKMPCVVVSEKMGISGVCKVFTKINTSGISLGAFDLLVAVMYPQNIFIKQKFDDAMDQYPLLKILDEKSKRYLLQTIALFENISPKTALLPEVLKPHHIINTWDKACKTLEKACETLDKYCGSALSSGNDKNLVYSPLVASLAVILDRYPIEGSDISSTISLLRQKKIQAWYFGSGISNRYSDGTDAKQNQDIKEMSEWFSSPDFDTNMPKWLNPIFANLNTGKSSAVGTSIISLLNVKRPKDFHSSVEVGPCSNNSSDLHHIFPKGALKRKIMNERNIQDPKYIEKILKNEYQIDSVLNLTWILSDTNRYIIKDSLPSIYLKEIINQHSNEEEGKQNLINKMKDHFINEEALNYLLADDYINFIKEREKTIRTELKTTGYLKHLINNEE